MSASMTKRAPRSSQGPPMLAINSVSDLGATVDVEGLAGDVGGLVAAQEGRRRGDVLWVSDALDRIGLGVHLAKVLDVELEPASGLVGPVSYTHLTLPTIYSV